MIHFLRCFKMGNSVQDKLLDLLDDLEEKELERFHSYLQKGSEGVFKPIKRSRLEKASRTRTVDLMVETYGDDRAMEFARLILKKINKGKSEKKGETLQYADNTVKMYFMKCFEN